MTLLSAHGLHKSFGSHLILNGVDLTISEGEHLGLVGSNGSGKSTLAKILGGFEAPDRGELMVRRGARIASVTQVPEFDPEMSAFDSVALGLREWREVRRRHDAISQTLAEAPPDRLDALLAEQSELGHELERLGGWDREHQIRALLEHLSVPDPNAKMARLSGGEQRRVALARGLLAAPDLLILDEPTNHLDTATIDWLEEYLEHQFRGALLLVTHDRYFLDRLVTRTLELSRGTATSHDGGWSSYLESKAEREALEARGEANRQNFLRRELEWLRRQPKARGTKQKARTERAERAQQNQPARAGGQVQLALESDRQGGDVLELQSLGVDIAGRTLIRKLDLILRPKQRVGIIGRNGAGKTSLLRVITGQLQPTRGELRMGRTTRVSYLDQSRSKLDPSKTVAENVVDGPLSSETQLRFGAERLSPYSYLSRFSFRSEELHQTVSMLSGGEQARVALAKLLLEQCNLLLLDEPTNDLDVTTLGALEEMLVNFGGSVVVVTHDRYFLNRVATDILAFEGDGEVVHYVGNYDNYLSLRPAERSGRADPSPPELKVSASSAPSVAPARAAKLSYKEQRELDGMLELIDQLESSVKTLEAELADPELYQRDPRGVAGKNAELEATREQLEQKLARWVELESRR